MSDGQEIISEQHFWVSSYPYFDSTLVSIDCALKPKDQPEEIKLTFFDADGKVFNTAQVQYAQTDLGLLELEPFVSACKLESGMKHAHLKVESSSSYRHQIRIHTKEACSFLRELNLATKYMVPCFPILLSPERNNFLSVVSLGGAPAKIKCRLFVGNRAPETTIDVPTDGVKLIHLESQFEEFLKDSRSIQAYARLVTLNDSPAGVQHVEQLEASSGANIFYSVS